jgi:hypothetical protein
MNCEGCGRIVTIEDIEHPCQADDSTLSGRTMKIKEIGCKECRASKRMFFYCESGAQDSDTTYSNSNVLKKLRVRVTNTDT